MCMASLSDLAQGKQLSVANSVLWACAGLGVILGPILEGAVRVRFPSLRYNGSGRSLRAAYHVEPVMCHAQVLSRGFAIRYSYLLAAAISAVQVGYQATMVDETHTASERKTFSVDGINPLGFLQLFTRRTPTTLKKLVLVASLQSFLEGAFRFPSPPRAPTAPAGRLVLRITWSP
jgi:hypothetical protein